MDILDYVDAEIALVLIKVLNPLCDVMGNVSTVSVQVTAQFIDATCFMPHDIPYAALRAAKGIHLQSGRRAVIKTDPKKLMGKVSSSVMESRKKSSAHVVSKNDEVDTVSKGELAIVKLGKIAVDVAETTGKIMTVAAMFGLSKPVTNARTDVVQVQPLQSFANGDGIDHSVKLGMSVENGIDMQPIVGGSNEDEMNLLKIVMTPMLLITQALVAGTPATPLAPVGPQVELSGPWHTTYVDWVSKLFKYVSGSYKFKIYITASLMQAIRLVFFLSDDPTNEQDWMNCYHTVVDVQGDTEVEFLLPYCFRNIMRRTVGVPQVFTLWVKVLNWSTPEPTVSAPIYLNVYKAGAEDMQFGNLMQRCTYATLPAGFVQEPDDDFMMLQSNPRDDFKKGFKPMHESMMGYAHHGLVNGETYTSIRECVHKYHAISGCSNVTPVVAWNWNGYTNTLMIGPELFGQLFRFWRGSIRCKFIMMNPSKTAGLILQDSVGYVNTAGFATPMNPIIEVEIPYWDDLMFRSTSATGLNTNMYTCGTSQSFLAKACGDDFSFHFLKCPDNEIQTSVPTNFGLNQLRAYFNANS